MMNTQTKTVNFEYNGTHTAEVLIINVETHAKHVSLISEEKEVQSIDGRKCLDVFLEDSDGYHKMCKIAKSLA